MPSRSPESVENGLETETTKNEIEQSIAVETETQKNTKCNCFNFKSFAKRGCRTIKYFLLGGSPALCPNGGEIGCDFAPSLINTVHSQTSLSACLI